MGGNDGTMTSVPPGDGTRAAAGVVGDIVGDIVDDIVDDTIGDQ